MFDAGNPLAEVSLICQYSVLWGGTEKWFSHICAAPFAVLAFFVGIHHIVFGLMVGSELLSPDALARYTTASSPGKVIDKGLLAILAAIVLGTLAEISFSVGKPRPGDG